MEPVTMMLQHAIAPEDAARAEFYALLASLYGGPPRPALLAAIGAAQPWSAAGDDPLAAAWNALIVASRAMDAEAGEQEYTDLFIGVGKCEVNPHGSHWIAGFMMEKPLADLRTDLAELDLARKPGVTMLEDHLAALFEIMRVLIAGVDSRQPASLDTQRRFFQRQIAPWVFQCCDAIENSPVANYYRRVAQFNTLFMAVERDSLAIV